MSKNHRYANNSSSETEFDAEAEKLQRREKMARKKSHNKKDKDYQKKYGDMEDDRGWN